MTAKGPRTPNPPVTRASTILLGQAADLYRTDIRVYGRFGHEVHDGLKSELCALEGAEACALAPSGLAAVTAALMGLCQAGDHVLVTDACYRPTRRLAESLSRFGIEAEFYEPRIGGRIVERLRPSTRAVLVESPGSLTFEVQDIPAIAAAAHAQGALVLVDDAWSGGVCLKPLALGADVAILPLTKYPSGGSDVFLGAALSRDAELGGAIARHVRETGTAVSSDDAYLALRGLRTLGLRMARHQESGLAVARWLEARPEVARVLHPGLASHPDHALWRRDFSGASGLFGVVLRPACERKVHAFLDALTAFGLGFSYGGYESLALWCDPQLLRTAAPWTGEGPLLRFSIGLEPVEALIADLAAGFAAMAEA